MSLGFEMDLAACLALRDRRSSENKEARLRCASNRELSEELLRAANQRGEPAIDWSSYFMELGINHP